MSDIERLKREFNGLLADIERENKQRSGDDYELPIDEYIEDVQEIREKINTYPTS